MAFVLPCSAAEPLDQLLACRGIADATARLVCFDRETAALASGKAPVPASRDAAAALSTATAPTPKAAATEHMAPPLDAQQSFGLNTTALAANEEAAGARPPKVSKIEGHVSALALAGNGQTVFTLDNSQVWRQTEAGGEMLAKLGDAVTISRGLLGSYWLQIKSGRGCKVTRLR